MSIPNVRVRNMESPRSGNPIANQFLVKTDDGEYFQSYDTVIGLKRNDGVIVLDTNSWNYSATTARYRREWLCEGINETRSKINAGQYIMADLNQ